MNRRKINSEHICQNQKDNVHDHSKMDKTKNTKDYEKYRECEVAQSDSGLFTGSQNAGMKGIKSRILQEGNGLCERMKDGAWEAVVSVERKQMNIKLDEKKGEGKRVRVWNRADRDQKCRKCISKERYTRRNRRGYRQNRRLRKIITK